MPINKHIINKIICLSLLMITSSLSSQSNINFYNNNVVPKYLAINPAFVRDYNFFLAVPFLSTIKASFFINSVKISEILDATDSHNAKDASNELLLSLKPFNTINAQAQIDVFAFGFRFFKKNFVSLGVAHKLNIELGLSKDILHFLINKDLSINLRDDYIRLLDYNSYNITYARHIAKKIAIGIKLKLLQGFFSAELNNFNVNININKSNPDQPLFATNIKAQYNLQVSAPEKVRNLIRNNDFQNPKDMLEILTDFSNLGFALDFGAEYKYSNKLQFSAAVRNIGFIKWASNNSTQYKAKQNAEFLIEGIDIELNKEDVLQDIQEQAEAIIDSLKSRFTPIEEETEYQSNLSPEIFINAEYNFSKNLLFNFTVSLAKDLQDKITSSYGVSSGVNIFSFLHLLGSYSFFSSNIHNIGAGIRLDLGPLQIYSLLNNIQVFKYKQIQNANLSFGANLEF